jgi:hypothetical protein
MLAGKHLSRAAKSGLHLIGDEQDAVALADLFDHAKVFRRGHDITPFALNRLHKDSGNFLRGDFVTKHDLLEVLNALNAARAVGEIIRAAMAITVGDVMDAR